MRSKELFVLPFSFRRTKKYAPFQKQASCIVPNTGHFVKRLNALFPIFFLFRAIIIVYEEHWGHSGAPALSVLNPLLAAPKKSQNILQFFYICETKK